MAIGTLPLSYRARNSGTKTASTEKSNSKQTYAHLVVNPDGHRDSTAELPGKK